MKVHKRRNSTQQTLTAGIALAVIIISVTYVNNRLSYFETVAADGTSDLSSSSMVMTDQGSDDVNNHWRTYNNPQFGYQLGYPAGWIVEAEKTSKDAAGNISSVVTIHSADGQKSVSIEANKGWTARSGASGTAQAMINGKNQIVSLFSTKAGCKAGQDCSMLVVTMKKGDYWYSLVGQGNARSYDGTYKDVFSSFQFTK